MQSMRTLLAFILTVLNFISLTSILSLSFMKSEEKNDLAFVIIVAFVSYFFGLLLLSSFCLTENECCETCCPAEKCCLCVDEKKKVETGNKKKQGACQDCCDLITDCCIRPIGGCARKCGKQGVRYTSLIILSVAHLGMVILCFSSVKGKNTKMGGRTIGVVIDCIFMVLVNLFGLIAPFFSCCEKLRYDYVYIPEKKSETKIVEDNSVNNTNYNSNNNIEVNNNKNEPLLQKTNSQKSENDNNNITVNSNNNDDVANNNFSNVFGVNRENQNNSNNDEVANNNFSNVFGVNREN